MQLVLVGKRIINMDNVSEINLAAHDPDNNLCVDVLFNCESDDRRSFSRFYGTDADALRDWLLAHADTAKVLSYLDPNDCPECGTPLKISPDGKQRWCNTCGWNNVIAVEK